jgi:formylglycine-generating enzyme required for sulfatase activity
MVFLALSLLLLGCEYPLETVYIEVPVETLVEIGGGCECESVEDDPDSGKTGVDYSCCPEAPENYCGCPEFPETPETSCNCPEDQPLAIIGFTFTQTNPIRAAYSVRDRTIGRFSDPIGGTAPFRYALVTGDGINDMDNGRFMVSGDSLKIQTDRLASGVYCVHVGITDNRGMSYNQAFTIIIAPDPVVLDQETRMVQGINFKMRYVPSGAFWRPMNVSMAEDMDDWHYVIPISAGFWVSETTITQGLYEIVMDGENPSFYRDNPVAGEIQDLRPVENVTLYETILFCNRLSIATGREPVYYVWGTSDWETYLRWATSNKSIIAASNIYIDDKANGYRLPTVDEWTWAAIGADVQNPGQVNTAGVKKYYSGGTIEVAAGREDFAWVYSNSSGVTHEVAKKQCNELGLFDMTGNIHEWAWGKPFESSWDNSVISSGGDIEAEPIYRITGNSRASPSARILCGIRIVSNQ